MDTSIAQWIRLCLLSSPPPPGSSPQPTIYAFSFIVKFVLFVRIVKNTKINKKRPCLARYFFKKECKVDTCMLLAVVMVHDHRRSNNRWGLKVLKIKEAWSFRNVTKNVLLTTSQQTFERAPIDAFAAREEGTSSRRHAHGRRRRLPDLVS